MQLLCGLVPHDDKPLRVSVQGDFQVEHDFQEVAGPCMTTLRVHVQNCGTVAASVVLETGSGAGGVLSPRTASTGG